MKMIVLVLIGLCLGSWFNVITSRKDWYKGRSKCDNCRTVIKWYDLIPIVSYCLLLGKCRKCKAKINVKHLISEMLLGIGFGVVSALDLSFFDSVIAYITILSLGFNSVMDLNQHKMEAITNYLAILIIGYLRLRQYWNTDVLTIYITIFVLLCLTFIIFYIAFEGKVGFGDFEALMLVLLSCGYWNGIYVLFYSAIVSAFYIAPLLLLKKISLKQALPLLPFMYLGYLTNLILM